MTGFVRDTIRNMEGYVPGEQINRDVIKLNTNENPYPPSPLVRRALEEYAAEELRLYPPPMADEIVAAAARVYGMPEECILAGNGSDDLLTIVFRAFLAAGDTVTTFYPTYTLYETLARLQDARLRYVDFTPEMGIPPDFTDEGSRFVILANPNSPTGTMVPAAEVALLADRVSGVLVVDEAYADFARENCLELVRERENVVVLRSFSKSFSLAGLRLGLAFAHPSLVREFAKVKDSYNVDRLAARLGAAALQDYAWMEENARKIRETRRRMVESLAALGMESLPSEANFVFARVPGGRAEELYRRLKEEGVLVRYFPGRRTGEYVRISVGTDEEVDAFLEAVSRFLSCAG